MCWEHLDFRAEGVRLRVWGQGEGGENEQFAWKTDIWVHTQKRRKGSKQLFGCCSSWLCTPEARESGGNRMELHFALASYERLTRPQNSVVPQAPLVFHNTVKCFLAQVWVPGLCVSVFSVLAAASRAQHLQHELLSHLCASSAADLRSVFSYIKHKPEVGRLVWQQSQNYFWTSKVNSTYLFICF